MDEMNGAFEEKKRRKGGKRLMQPEKAAKAPKAPRAEKPPRVPRETSGKTGKVVGIVAGVLVVAYLGLGAWASARAWGVQSSAEKRWQLNSPAGPSAIFFVMRST